MHPLSTLLCYHPHITHLELTNWRFSTSLLECMMKVLSVIIIIPIIWDLNQNYWCEILNVCAPFSKCMFEVSFRPLRFFFSSPLPKINIQNCNLALLINGGPWPLDLFGSSFSELFSATLSICGFVGLVRDTMFRTSVLPSAGVKTTQIQ